MQYGIRPEHLALEEEGLPFNVDVVEPTGSDTMIYGRLDDQPVVVNIRDRVDVRAGDLIHIRPNLEKVLAFDAETGGRI